MLECLGNEKLEPRTVDRGQTGICTEPDKSDKQQNVQKLQFKAQIYKADCALCCYRKTVSFIGDGSEMRYLALCFFCHHRYVVIINTVDIK